ncbi:MAG: hypothetical protein ACREEE_14560 [Dongiaceae bacterium]
MALPRRASIDPIEIAPLLPNILLNEITRDPLRIRCRLVGTACVQYAHLDFTGMYLDELDFGPTDIEDWPRYYALLCEYRKPLFGETAISFGEEGRTGVEFGIFPLSSDGATVSQCISLEDYEPVKRCQLDLLERTPVSACAMI